MQGVAFAIADAMDVLQEAGSTPDMLLVTGGGANNRIWLEMIASLLKRPLLLPKNSDTGAALGAARLAMIAGGASVASVCTKPELSAEVLPDHALTTKLSNARTTSHALCKISAPYYPKFKDKYLPRRHVSVCVFIKKKRLYPPKKS